MTQALAAEALDQLFNSARTHSVWLDKTVEPALLHQLYDLLKMAPTSANCSPARIVFVTSPDAKARLAPALDEGNRAKTMAAPVTAIIGYDLQFHDQLSYLFPHSDARAWFAGNDVKIQTTAFRNGSLQGAYLILAARALGLDCGPMSGFNNAMVDAEFFAGTAIKSNFLCNLGYGDRSALYARSPRFAFNQACSIV